MRKRRYSKTTMIPCTVDIAPIDSLGLGHLLKVLAQFTYTPDQAEHAMVILRGQTVTDKPTELRGNHG